MEAPDKIWVTTSEMTELLSEKRHDYDVAYIRKDALLEWAKETYLNENASAIRKVCYKQLIDKLNSL